MVRKGWRSPLGGKASSPLREQKSPNNHNNNNSKWVENVKQLKIRTTPSCMNSGEGVETSVATKQQSWMELESEINRRMDNAATSENIPESVKMRRVSKKEMARSESHASASTKNIKLKSPSHIGNGPTRSGETFETTDHEDHFPPPKDFLKRKQQKDKEQPQKSKKGGKLAWLRSRKSKLKEPETPKPESLVLSPRNNYQPTSPSRLQAWVTEAKNAIEQARLVEILSLEDLSNGSHGEGSDTGVGDQYYRHTKEVGVYVDYSTFDDAESISSIGLLFKWLTCRELPAEEKEKKLKMDPRGMVIATDSPQSHDLGEWSWDEEAKPRRRILFSR